MNKMAEQIKNRIAALVHLPVVCSFDDLAEQFNVKVFCAESDKFAIQDKIFELEHELFPNVEYLISPLVFTMDETKKYYPEMLPPYFTYKAMVCLKNDQPSYHDASGFCASRYDTSYSECFGIRNMCDSFEYINAA